MVNAEPVVADHAWFCSCRYDADAAISLPAQAFEITWPESMRERNTASETDGQAAALDVAEEIIAYQLRESPGHLLRRCAQRAVSIFAEEVGSRKMTARQFALLIAVSQRPGLTQSDLVEATGIDRSTVGEMVKRLVRRGHLRRKRSGVDQRANLLYVQPTGMEILRSILAAVARAESRIFDPVPPELRSSLVTALKLMAGQREDMASSTRE
jgi:DNA-binding MarR family transcriptional regulator